MHVPCYRYSVVLLSSCVLCFSCAGVTLSSVCHTCVLCGTCITHVTMQLHVAACGMLHNQLQHDPRVPCVAYAVYCVCCTCAVWSPWVARYMCAVHFECVARDCMLCSLHTCHTLHVRSLMLHATRVLCVWRAVCRSACATSAAVGREAWAQVGDAMLVPIWVTPQRSCPGVGVP